ncbi:putative dithiol-disulfide oxidoreductase (DUF899 family) [Rhizobium sp. BK316]|uniref:DUF899 domain-containing protein n=1 Tax=Rhizobium sp. BK316 TaxID=2587053 RepID=UPI00160AB5FE|nr:thioredoxin family protein [Rhizobium sp. BK316]MBB3410032.1 putative dithiol-disulfide oxidoreductase (DUF899 family) [Rhizobium sp. BK316]
MMTHKTGTRAEWLQARLALLEEEKALTRRSDEIAAKRRDLPWVKIEKEYRLETEKGVKPLSALFKGRSQLLVYHFMFGPDYTAGCPSCSSIADGFNGVTVHLENHDVAFSAVSRAPLEKLLAFKRRMGWTFDWASSSPSDFNRDFNVWFTPEEQQSGGIEYNFRREPPVPAVLQKQEPNAERSPADLIASMTGTDLNTFARERPGLSAFVMQGGDIYHTYSSYARGLDGVWGMYQWLDRAPFGRNEEGVWWRHHDRYEAA